MWACNAPASGISIAGNGEADDGSSPPNNADLGTLDLPLCFVDICYPLSTATGSMDPQRWRKGASHLAQVELRILLGCNALDLKERGIWAGVALSALVAKDTAF